MKALKKMSLDLKNKIRQYAKNGIDISPIIEGYSLQGEDLSHCIIKNIKRIDEDISGANFSFTKIGNIEKEINYFIRVKAVGCNFDSAQFTSPTWIRSCDAKNSNFRNCDLSKVDYRNSDLRQSTFCDTIIKIGTAWGVGCKFDNNMFDALTKGWDIKVRVVETKE